jgi:hypothetical protein
LEDVVDTRMVIFPLIPRFSVPLPQRSLASVALFWHYE